METSETPARPPTMRYGCDDCGKLWSKKSEVDVRCRPYVGRVVKDSQTFTGYAWADACEIGYLWTGGY